ncbi:MAG: CBS domain-containing protein [Desulfurococcales archaeon]|nr:CBS domain-containing protein [Desulfurococcales archaeon]
MTRLSPRLRLGPTGSLATRDFVSVSPGTSLSHVRKVMRTTGARVVLVVEDGRLQGWVARSNVLTVTSRKTHATAKDVMEYPKVVAYPSDEVSDVVARMLDYDEWYAPVVEEQEPVGLLGLEHVIKAGLERAPDRLTGARVDEIMTPDPVTVGADDYIQSIWALMRDRKYAGFPVVDEKGRLIGIITQYDLIARGYTRIELESSSGPARGPRVRDAMRHTVYYLYPWSSVAEAAQLMVEKGIGRVPIVRNEESRRLVGIVDREDVVRFLLGM